MNALWLGVGWAFGLVFGALCGGGAVVAVLANVVTRDLREARRVYAEAKRSHRRADEIKARVSADLARYRMQVDPYLRTWDEGR